MKKTLSVILALVMVLSLSLCLIPASAAGQKPTFDAKDSKIVGASCPKAAANVNLAAMYDGSYGGDNLNPCEGITAFGNTATAQILGGTAVYQAGTRYTAFSEKGDEYSASANYNVFIQLTLGENGTAARTKVSSITFAVPASASKVAGCVPNGFTLYYGDGIFMNSSTNEEPKIMMNKNNMKYLCTVTNLLDEDKYIESSDGYRYYECNLPKTIEATYLFLLFSSEFDLKNTVANNSGDKEATKAPTVYSYFTEFAAFADPIPLGDDAGTQEYVHVDTTEAPEETSAPETEAPETLPAPTTDPVAPVVTEAPATEPATQPATPDVPATGDVAPVVIAVAAIAVILSAAVLLRKKENN